MSDQVNHRQPPKGWKRVPIGEVCDLKNGYAFKPSDWSREGLPIVRIQNLNNPSASFNHYSGELRDRFKIKSGDLLFAWSGTPGTSFGAHIWRGGKAALNQHIFRIDFDEQSLHKKFFMYAINQKLTELIAKAHGGVGLRHVTKGKFEATEIDVPPYGVQERLVASIDALLSELDKGIESLKTAREQLKVYRQAVLKHAFEGKLTAQWREENKDKLESPVQLLARIQHEREARYQQQLEEWKAAVKAWEAGGKEGKKPGKPRAPASARKIVHPQFEVPKEWTVLDLEALAIESVLGKMLDKEKNSGIERPYLGNINVRWGEFNLDNLKSMKIESSEIDRYSVKAGDLVICEGGEPVYLMVN